MQTVSKNKELLIVSLIMILVCIIGFEFAVSDRLAGFSDDSGTYLLMASVFSPYYDVTENIIRSYEYFQLPPGFAFVLALFGQVIMFILLIALFWQSYWVFSLFSFYLAITLLGRS